MDIGGTGIPAVGLASCLLLAFSLPLQSVLIGAGVVVIGAVVYAARRLR